MAQVWFTCVVGFLCCLPLLNACTWDPNTEVEQGLDIKSYDNGAAYLASLPEISDAEACQQACCDRNDCQIALIGTPADGKSECRLVSCIKDGVDVCVLTPSTQFKVYRKIVGTGDVRNQNDVDVRAPFTTDDCRLSSVVGNCRAALPRFYYNVTSQTCQQFIYGGCGGNNNNFETQVACETACTGVTGTVLSDSHVVSQRSRMSNPEDISADEPKVLSQMTSEEFQEKCLAPAKTGPCRASIRRYFYNNGNCEMFIYGGCKGNKNSYETEEECMTTCTVTVIPKNEEAPVTPSSPNQEACFAPADSGSCRAAFPMFYFESSTQSCKSFIYGGCKGNQNRYSSEEECMSACAGNQWSFEGQRTRRWTPAFFLVATLAIMSAVLLVGLILIAVRRGSRRFLILDDKEELLPADEWSVEHSPKIVSE